MFTNELLFAILIVLGLLSIISLIPWILEYQRKRRVNKLVNKVMAEVHKLMGK